MIGVQPSMNVGHHANSTPGSLRPLSTRLLLGLLEGSHPMSLYRCELCDRNHPAGEMHNDAVRRLRLAQNKAVRYGHRELAADLKQAIVEMQIKAGKKL